MVRAVLWVCLIVLTGVNARAEEPVWNAAARDAWWAANPQPQSWRRAASEKLRELDAAYQPSDSGDLSPALLGWFNHLRWVSMLSSEDFAKTGLTVAEFRALDENEVLARTFLNEIRSKDKPVEAVKILGQIYRAFPQDLAAYPVLAVAYALVFDVPFPEDWPHHQVKRLPWEDRSGTPAERFAYYVDLDKKRKLDFSPANLSFTELKFMVDSLVSPAEMTWGRDEVRINVGNFDNLFNSIRYDMKRYYNQQYSWPDNTPYTLSDIQQKGGICVDQAYFGAMVGKARGIPTLYFSGQGTDGGHAWYGYLKRNRSWDLDVGRYASQNYPVGEARDPQTWDEVNDEQLKQFTEVVLQNSRYPTAEMLLYWAEANREQPFYKTSIDRVRELVPGWIYGWRATAGWMKRTKQTLEVQKEFYRQWTQQYLKYPELRVEGQSRLLEVMKEAGDVDGAKAVHADVVRQNRRKRFDIGIDAGMEPVLALLDKEDWKGAESEYKKLVRQFDNKGGGNLFNGVVWPFVSICIDEKQTELARDALEYAEKKMKPEPRSLVSQAFGELSDKLNGREKPAEKP